MAWSLAHFDYLPITPNISNGIWNETLLLTRRKYIGAVSRCAEKIEKIFQGGVFSCHQASIAFDDFLIRCHDPKDRKQHASP